VAYYWIKERHNPQTGVYYTPCGKLPAKKARRMETSVYGENIMHKFSRREAYLLKIKELKTDGQKITEEMEI
jgi:hypothetical protein